MTATTDREALLDTLWDAKRRLTETINLVDRFDRYAGDDAAQAHILTHLRNLAARDHGFISRNLTIDDLTESLVGQGA